MEKNNIVSNNDKISLEGKNEIPKASGLLSDVKGPRSSRSVSGIKRKRERTSEESSGEKKACLPGDISKETEIKKTMVDKGTQTDGHKRSLLSRLFKVKKSKTRKRSLITRLFKVPKNKHGMKPSSVSNKNK